MSLSSEIQIGRSARGTLHRVSAGDPATPATSIHDVAQHSLPVRGGRGARRREICVKLTKDAGAPVTCDANDLFDHKARRRR